jgi:hypothetical protein
MCDVPQPDKNMWWQRPSQTAPFGTVAELRHAALDMLQQRPDLCRWQERAGEAGHHVTAYCLLSDKLDHLEFALSDERFDGFNVAAREERAGRDLLYLYDTFALRAEQLLRELDYLMSTTRRQRDPITVKINAYVNTMTKHRAEQHRSSIGPYDRDHHAVLSFADFDVTPQEPGISLDGQIWGVPSLYAAAQHLCDRVTIFDRALEDVATRTAVEDTRSIAWT